MLNPSKLIQFHADNKINTEMENLIWFIPGLGMIAVAIGIATAWRRSSRIQFRWLFIGAGLWTVAVGLKIVSALLLGKPTMAFLKESLSNSFQIVIGGLFVGIHSSIYEIGLTFLAVIIWRQLGRDGKRAIAIGVGAGAFEALVLGLVSLVSIVIVIIGAPGAEEVREGLEKGAAVTPFLWLVAPVERIIAILCHASSRALVLLGVVWHKRLLVLYGFVIFTLLDGVAATFDVAGKVGAISMWWIELTLLPFALVSIPILKWCYKFRAKESR